MFGTEADPRDAVRPLWHRLVALSREPQLYACCGVADTVDGRFDMIVHLLGLVMLRMEKSPDLSPRAALLAELFVEDMDGQLRETGLGDAVAKHMGRLMAALGGRMGALRRVMADGDAAALTEILERNVHWAEPRLPGELAARFIALAADLASRSDAEVLAGEFGG